MGHTWRKDRDHGRSDKHRRNRFPRDEFIAPAAHATPAASTAVAVPDSYLYGKVKYYNADKGFGFITRDDVRQDIFFHCSRLVGIENPAVGTAVKFTVEDSPKGPRACNVQVNSPV